MRSPAARLLSRSDQYLRTARAAHQAGDDDAAFENARTAAELAAKAMLTQANVPYPRTHNVAGALAQQGLWPKGKEGARLAAFLSQSARAVYGIDNPVASKDVTQALRLAHRVRDEAERRISPHG